MIAIKVTLEVYDGDDGDDGEADWQAAAGLGSGRLYLSQIQ